MSKNNGHQDRVGHYRISIDAGYFVYFPPTTTQCYRIVNTRNGILNKRKFFDRVEAVSYAKRLLDWHKVNESVAGKKRTQKWNKAVVSAYHNNKGNK